jgi:hypothetical protein
MRTLGNPVFQDQPINKYISRVHRLSHAVLLSLPYESVDGVAATGK